MGAVGSLVLGSRLLLVGVFATAGVAKLLDLAGSRRSLEAFGLSKRVVPVAAVILPIAELATAIALVPRPSAQWGALAAFVLLLAFIGGIASALARGQSPDCHCFGQLHSSPAGRGTLVRNALLAVPAALVVVRGPGPALDSWISARTAAEVVAVAVAITALALGAIALKQWKKNRELTRDLAEARAELASLPPGLPVGASAPHFTLSDPRGTARTLKSLLVRGHPVALVFVSPDCESCDKLLPEVGRWQAILSDRLTTALISRGVPDVNRAVAEKHDVTDVLVQEDAEIMKAYRVGFTPTAVVVSPEGRIASPPAEGAIAIEALIRLILRAGATGATAAPLPSRQLT
jgi:peroxiredoxin/uncharacterized membrane protein YphA (DoxX/SURF4 family)